MIRPACELPSCRTIDPYCRCTDRLLSRACRSSWEMLSWRFSSSETRGPRGADTGSSANGEPDSSEGIATTENTP